MNPLQQRAKSVIPGGVNSPVRAFKNVHRPPLYATKAKGAFLYTTKGQQLIDYCCSFGPLILGHAHPTVIEATQQALLNGTSFAVTTEIEIQLAELITQAIKGADKVRLVNSGTEAVMTALRLARGATGRNKILKFSGCYHGHLDSMLVVAGSGVAEISEASSKGVTEQAASQTIVVPYNDPQAVSDAMEQHGKDIAAIITEPVAANMGLILPKEGFLNHLQQLCKQHGALLIFDEVITGFRLNYGGASNYFNIEPDLTCLGKIIGGGMPIGALAGKKEYMDLLAPIGPVYQAGTLSGNPVSVTCGYATLSYLRDHNPYPQLEKNTAWFTSQITQRAQKYDLELQIPHIASLFSLFFNPNLPTNFEQVCQSDSDQFVRLFHALLDRDIYLAPSPFEAGFLSVAHTKDLLEKTLQHMDDAMAQLV